MEENQQEQMQPQEPIAVSLYLNIGQVQTILAALGKLPTETDVWPLRQYIINQTNQQLQAQEQEVPA